MNLSSKQRIVRWIFSIILVGIVLYRINMFYGIIIINDEFGYWGIAAQIAGKNWKDLLSTTPYYSYGYSLLLVPLFWLNLTAEQMYVLAIIMNCIMLIGSFLLAEKCQEKMFPQLNGTMRIITAFVVTLYTNNIIQAQIAWTETLLYFLYWCVFYIILKTTEESKGSDYILLAILTGYMYMVHQRNIGVVLSVLLILGLRLLRNVKEWKEILKFVLVFILGLVVHSFLKKYFISQYFSANELVSGNDYSGQVGKFQQIFGSVTGILYFIESILGKIYYLMIGTFFLIVPCVKDGMEKACSLLTREGRKKGQYAGYETFLLLSIGASLMITAIFMHVSTGRLDVLVYGRYMEFVVGPILLYGIGKLLTQPLRCKDMLVCACALIIITIIVNVGLTRVETQQYNSFCTTMMAYFFKNSSQVNGIAFSAACFSLTVVFLIILLEWCAGRIENKRVNLLILGIIGMGWMFLLNQNGASAAQSIVEREISDVVEEMERFSDLSLCYYVIDEEDYLEQDFTYTKYIQFRFPDLKIEIITESELENVNSGYVLSEENNSKIEKLDNVKVLEKTGKLMLAKIEK